MAKSWKSYFIKKIIHKYFELISHEQVYFSLLCNENSYANLKNVVTDQILANLIIIT